MSLVKNAGWNILGTGVSALAMIPAMAYVARQLDVESFGLLTLVLAFFGYATVLDAGVARAVIREVALSRTDLKSSAGVVGTGFWLVLLFGLLSTFVLISMSRDLVVWLNVSSALAQQAGTVLITAALSVLPLLLTALWVAPVEGMGLFRALNLIRGLGYPAIFGSISFAVWLQPTIIAAMDGLLVGRLIMATMACVAGCRAMGQLPLAFDRPALLRLYRFGGWLTISNIVSHVMDYFDRFAISAIAGADRVAFYSGPAEMVAKLLTIPHAVSRALFPHLSAQSVSRSPTRQDLIAPLKAQMLIGLLMLLVALFFGDWLMGVWLGQGYAATSGPVFKILAVGYVFYALMLVPFTVLQAAGYARITAFIYLIELPFYLAFLVFMIHTDGIRGAALVWVAKTLFELLMFWWLSKKYVFKVETA